MSTPANFNGQRPVIDANDAVMLLIDHQSGLFQTVADMPMTELRARAAALASIATLSKLPVITTASVPQGPNGPLIRKFTKMRRTRNTSPAKGNQRLGQPGLRSGGQSHRPQNLDHRRHHHQRLHGLPVHQRGGRRL